MNDQKEVYVLEYNKTQDAYHIQTIEDRRKRNNNDEWPIQDQGTMAEMSSLVVELRSCAC